MRRIAQVRPSPLIHRWTVLATLAAALVLVPHALNLAVGSIGPKLIENRTLAAWPSMPSSISGWKELPRKLESAAQDQFPLRASLVTLTNGIRYMLGYSTVGNVTVGREGWLFYSAQDIVSYHTGRRPPWSPVELDNWLNVFDERVRQLKAKNIEYIMLVAPRKPTIYPEKTRFPAVVHRDVDVLIAAAKARGNNRIIYPRDALLEAKNDRQLFGAFDTHWNGYGAYVAYTALMTRLAEADPDLKPLPLTAFSSSTRHQGTGDLTQMLGIDHWVSHDLVLFNNDYRTQFRYLGKRQHLIEPAIIETKAPSSKTLLLVRDSFSEALLPMLERHFRRIVLAHYGQGDFRQDLIDRYAPDVVILEMIETSARTAMGNLRWNRKTPAPKDDSPRLEARAQ